MAKSYRRFNFSLVEMVVLLAVMFVILTMSVTAYRKLVVGNVVDSSAKTVGSQIIMSRQLAVAKRRFTALIMPADTAGLDAQNQYSACRVAYVDFNGVSTYTFNSWAEDSEWNFCLTGARIMEADGDIGIQDGSGLTRDPHDTDFSVVNGVDLAGIGGGNSVRVRALIFSPTGRVKGETRFITIGESIWVGGTWNIPKVASIATNESTANQITIVVNRFTGSMEYRRPLDY